MPVSHLTTTSEVQHSAKGRRCAHTFARAWIRPIVPHAFPICGSVRIATRRARWARYGADATFYSIASHTALATCRPQRRSSTHAAHLSPSPPPAFFFGVCASIRVTFVIRHVFVHFRLRGLPTHISNAASGCMHTFRLCVVASGQRRSGQDTPGMGDRLPILTRPNNRSVQPNSHPLRMPVLQAPQAVTSSRRFTTLSRPTPYVSLLNL